LKPNDHRLNTEHRSTSYPGRMLRKYKYDNSNFVFDQMC
jgi:hypothetical protein